jgi:hypothetical protein
MHIFGRVASRTFNFTSGTVLKRLCKLEPFIAFAVTPIYDRSMYDVLT